MFKLLFEMKFILTHQTRQVFASELYVRKKTSDESCVITKSIDYFGTESFEFFISVNYKVRKRLKQENVPLFKLLFEMKFNLMRQTRCYVNKNKRRVGMICVIITML